MLTLREFLVKTPEDLDDGKRGGGDGIGKVSSWGRDGADDGDASFSFRGALASDAACALVELGELGRQIGRVTLIGRHFCQPSGNFSECFGPAGGGVSHHGDIVTHISEVLCERDSGID